MPLVPVFSISAWRTGAWFVAVLGLVGAVAMSLNHPVAPLACLILLSVWCCVAVWQPGAWLGVVPACLPWLNFSPWTGWVVFEEFDILLLATIACGYARLAWRGGHFPPMRMTRAANCWVMLCLASALASLWRGVDDAGGLAWDWYAGYTDALNAWRVFKSLCFAALCLPLLPRTDSSADASGMKTFAWGVLCGLVVVAVSVVWERAAFTGVTDFSSQYRIVALFWEMHVGGAALDVYLVLTAPFIVWALVNVRRRQSWLLIAGLAVLLVYAALTTFSRGVYLAMGLSIAVLIGRLWWQARQAPLPDVCPKWRARSDVALLLVVMLEVVAVVVGGTFLSERLSGAERDMVRRLDHWRSGVGLMNGPSDWLLGKGLGRLPSQYARAVADGEFSGAVQWQAAGRSAARSGGQVVLFGPRSNPDVAGMFALTQRVETTPGDRYRVAMRLRVVVPTRLDISLCERHLLYERDCLVTWGTVRPVRTQDGWQTLSLSLRGQPLDADPWYGPRLKLFAVSVASVASRVEIDSLQLLAPDGTNLLANGNFADGLAHWLGVAQSYFDPWHLDNFALEVLVERGLAGLLPLAALFAIALWQLLGASAKPQSLAPYFAAAMLGVLLVGLVSSVADVPRVAFLFYLLLLASLRTGQHGHGSMVDCRPYVMASVCRER